MKVVRVLGSEKCYEFEDGEKVPFTDKARYIEKRYGDANKNRPTEPEKTKAETRTDGDIHEVGGDPSTGGDVKEVGEVTGRGRPSFEANGADSGIRKKKGRKRKRKG